MPKPLSTMKTFTNRGSWDDKLPRFKFPQDGTSVRLRLVGDGETIMRHWVYLAKGGKSMYPCLCPQFNPYEEDLSLPNKCWLHDDFQDYGQRSILINAIIRDEQKRDDPAHGRRLLELPSSLLKYVKKISEVIGCELNDPEGGHDVLIAYDKNEKGPNKWTITHEKHTPLRDWETPDNPKCRIDYVDLAAVVPNYHGLQPEQPAAVQKKSMAEAAARAARYADEMRADLARSMYYLTPISKNIDPRDPYKSFKGDINGRPFFEFDAIVEFEQFRNGKRMGIIKRMRPDAVNGVGDDDDVGGDVSLRGAPNRGHQMDDGDVVGQRAARAAAPAPARRPAPVQEPVAQDDEEDEAPAPAPAPKRAVAAAPARRPAPAPVDETDDYEQDDEPVAPPPKKKAPVAARPAAVQDDLIEAIEDEDEAPAPAPKKKAPPAKVVADFEDDEDAPPPPPAKKKPKAVDDFDLGLEDDDDTPAPSARTAPSKFGDDDPEDDAQDEEPVTPKKKATAATPAPKAKKPMAPSPEVSDLDDLLDVSNDDDDADAVAALPPPKKKAAPLAKALPQVHPDKSIRTIVDAEYGNVPECFRAYTGEKKCVRCTKQSLCHEVTDGE